MATRTVMEGVKADSATPITSQLIARPSQVAGNVLRTR
ncbi:MAG: hypothetical protein A4E69_02552 [Syntrophus sp. PtaB.Bin138]|nr:MAG: hypothetical protein A4E69_02552 [Syntrophus sp. PtaB.Bin138]